MLLNSCPSAWLRRAAIATAALLLLLCADGASAQQAAPAAAVKAPAFEVVAIKLSDPDSHGQNWNGNYDRLTIQNYTLRHLIRVAYNLKTDAQVVGGPAWIGKQSFDISAKLDDADAARLKNGH